MTPLREWVSVSFDADAIALRVNPPYGIAWEVYDRFAEIAAILKQKYGTRLVDLVPTSRSLYALYGDSTAAYFYVARAREALSQNP
ncbi:MAG: hypothetical protein KDJ52_13065 [Anaerolineae bacterium]|nr:hypothetical protein [Anaerolineae bacterium]